MTSGSTEGVATQLIWCLDGTDPSIDWPDKIVACRFGGHNAFAVTGWMPYTSLFHETTGALLGTVPFCTMLAPHPDGGLAGNFGGLLLAHVEDSTTSGRPIGFLGCEAELTECWSLGVGTLDDQPVHWHLLARSDGVVVVISGAHGLWLASHEGNAIGIEESFRLVQWDVDEWDVVDEVGRRCGRLGVNIVDWGYDGAIRTLGVSRTDTAVVVVTDQCWRFSDNRWRPFRVAGHPRAVCALGTDVGPVFALATDGLLTVLDADGGIALEHPITCSANSLTMVWHQDRPTIVWIDDSGDINNMALLRDGNGVYSGVMHSSPGLAAPGSSSRPIAAAVDPSGRLLVAFVDRYDAVVIREGGIVCRFERHAKDPVALCFGSGARTLAVGYGRLPVPDYQEFLDVFRIPDQVTEKIVVLKSGRYHVQVRNGPEG